MWTRGFSTRKEARSTLHSERENAQAERHGFDAKQRRFSLFFFSMQNQRRDLRGQRGAAKTEAPEFHAASGGALQLRHDLLTHVFVKPAALHYHQSRERSDYQQHSDRSQAA